MKLLKKLAIYVASGLISLGIAITVPASVQAEYEKDRGGSVMLWKAQVMNRMI